MTLLDSRTLRVLTTIFLFCVGLGFLYVAHSTLIAFLFAIFFAYLVEPAVSYLEKPLHSRAFAISAIYALLLGLLVTFFFFLGPHIARQTQRLTQSYPSLVADKSYTDIVGQIARSHGWNGVWVDQIEQFLSDHQNSLANIAQHLALKVADAAQQSWLLIVVPILAIFFLKDGRDFGETILALMQSTAQREFLRDVLDDLNQMLAQFIRAQLILAALSFVAYLTMLGVMRVPFAIALASAGGAFEFIPVVGPLVAGILITLIALVSGYSHWFLLLIMLFVWRMVQDYVISPRIMGRSMELHPLAAIFGVLAGAEVAGVLGVYLSIPVMASLRIVWRRWKLYAEKRRFGPLTAISDPQLTRASSPL